MASVIAIGAGAIAALLCAAYWRLRAKRSAAVRELEARMERIREQEQNIASLTSQLNGLASKLHHDLRGPLQSVMGFSDLLASETAGPLNIKQKQFLDNVCTAARKMFALMEAAQNNGAESTHSRANR